MAVSEGLTVDGEPLPAGDLTEAGFHAAVAAQVGKPREEIEAGGPHDAEADTADSIRGSLLDSEDRHNAIRAQIAGADLPLVEQGLEVLGVGGYMPLQPQPRPVAHRTVEELTGRIENRLRANTTRSEPIRRSDFHRAVLESESSHWHDGLTAGGLTGRRALELADGSRERYEREQQEARAQALSSAG